MKTITFIKWHRKQIESEGQAKKNKKLKKGYSVKYNFAKQWDGGRGNPPGSDAYVSPIDLNVIIHYLI